MGARVTNMAEPEKIGLCNAYLKGKCHRGKACRYRHDKEQKQASVAHLRDRFDSESDDDDIPTAQPVKTKSKLTAAVSLDPAEAAERKRLAAERSRQMNLLTASVPAESEGKTVSFHHGIMPKKRVVNPERQARKEKARELRQEAARQELEEAQKSAAAALSMAPEWDILKRAVSVKDQERTKELKEEMIRRQVEVKTELGEGGSKEVDDLWAQVEAARKPKKKQKRRK